ncbi:terminase TerL endonuclease subunit [Clostridium sp. YIM B02551]|uniref:terminase large subunit n=1 Tax=Clostridium sp. YIM B02551 TaxID=2910679 RepID=UPI001EE9B2EE
MDRATQFAMDVVAGSTLSTPIIAGEDEILCCKRHLNDLERQGTEDFPYIWDEDKANDIIYFAETLTLAEGEEPSQMILYPFQCFIFGSWNGWIHKDTGYRRFRTSYVKVGRQNGKSVGNAVPALYYGNFSGYQYPQVYTTATKELQARIVLKECIKFINADTELSGTKTQKGLFTVKDYKSEIECNLTKGVIKALGRDTESIDGFRPYFGSVDEFHKHKTNQMYKLLVDGTKKLKECLISVITTAGFDINCPCKELEDYCINVIRGIIKDETQFIFICNLDKGDDIWDENNWPKANPLWTPETLLSLRSDAIKAKEMQGEELRNFMTKSLNMWVQMGDDDYIDIEEWKECSSETTLEDMEGKECGVGLDLSSGGDLTSLSLIFKLPNEKYFVHTQSFMPKNRLYEHIATDKAPYDIWEKQGLIILTENMAGIKTDYKYIIRYLEQIRDKYNLKYKFIAYDPYNSAAFLSDLEGLGCDLIEIVQSARSLSSATEDFKLTVKAKNIIYDRLNGLMTWSIANAKLTYNSFGECKIDKNSNVKRIDPVDAIIDCWKVMMMDKNTALDINKYATDEFLDKLWG